MYKDYLIRYSNGKWEAAHIDDGWNDWLFTYSYDSFIKLKKRLDGDSESRE